MLLDLWPFVASALCAGMLMPIALRMRSVGHDQTGGLRKLHVAPTSRLGGTIVVIAFVASIGLARAFGADALQAALPLAFCALPVVLVGLADDLTCGVRPRYRLLAAVVSAMLAGGFAGGVVPRVDLQAVDALLAHAWFALPLTWFMVAGACNAINLIDGAHGLAGGTGLIMFAGIALAAAWSGDTMTLAPSLAIIGALAGFLWWNYPRGRIFLGDAGAYFIGFMYAELAIQLVSRNSGISAWYVVMLAGYPIVDTVFSMYRRGVVRRLPLMAPDGLHLHTLLFRRVAMPMERGLRARRKGDRRSDGVILQRANARVAPRLWLHGALCFVIAVIFRDNTPALWLGLIAYAVLYVRRYRSLVQFGRRRGQAVEQAVVRQHIDAAKPMR